MSKSRRFPISVGEQLSNIFKSQPDELTRVVASGCRLVELMLIAGVQMDLRKIKGDEQHPGFARGHPPYYCTGSKEFNFRDQTRAGAVSLIWPFMFTEDSYEHIEICVLNCFGCVIKNWNLIVAYSAKGAMKGLDTSMHFRVLPCEMTESSDVLFQKYFFRILSNTFHRSMWKWEKNWSFAVNGES